MFDIWSAVPETVIWIASNCSIGVAYLVLGIRHIAIFGGLGWMYGFFILFCGIGHFLMVAFMSVWPVQALWFWVAAVDSATAIISLMTAHKAVKDG